MRMMIKVLLAAASLAVLARATSLPRSLLKSTGQGGSSGVAFDELHLNDIVGIHSINISFGGQVDGFQVRYLLSNGALYRAPLRGKNYNPPINIMLGHDEYLEKVEGTTDGTVINQLTLTTEGPKSQRRVYGPFGKNSSTNTSHDFSFEGYIAGFFGRSDSYLNNISVYSLELLNKDKECCTPAGDTFDDVADIGVVPVIDIHRLFIWHDDKLAAIQAEYVLLGGNHWTSKKHGGDIDNRYLTTVTFDEGEQMASISGHFDEHRVTEISILAFKVGGVFSKYGPFGWNYTLFGKHFEVHGCILGFFGTTGIVSGATKITGLGIYYFED